LGDWCGVFGLVALAIDIGCGSFRTTRSDRETTS
jgi:hypothetical protein